MLTIDVRGLSHSEREAMIFPSIEKLKDGENLRLVVEFNPVPLVYLLKARDEFNVRYEKDGPDEWILNVERIKKEVELKRLLMELNQGINDETKKKAKKFLENVDAKTLGMIEQEIIKEGVPREEIRKNLCDIHLEALRDSLIAKRISVETSHPIHTFMEEHKIILDNLKRLRAIIKKLEIKNNLKNADVNKLKDIAHHLVEAESHHQREEDVLFVRLEKHNIVEPPAIMRMDHIEFRKRKQELYKLANNYRREFKNKVIEAGKYLTVELENHIFKEDNILYQIALQSLSAEEWAEIKKECDNIGYCCFTPTS